MKLNLAAGATGWPGFINSDIAPFAGKNGIQYLDVEKPFPYEDGSADLVIMSHGLCLREPKLHILSEIYRVLKPGGWFRLDDNPNRFWVREEDIDRTFPAHLLMPRHELVSLCTGLGFYLISEIDPDHTGIPADLQLEYILTHNKRFHPSFALEMRK